MLSPTENRVQDLVLQILTLGYLSGLSFQEGRVALKAAVFAAEQRENAGKHTSDDEDNKMVLALGEFIKTELGKVANVK